MGSAIESVRLEVGYRDFVFVENDFQGDDARVRGIEQAFESEWFEACLRSIRASGADASGE